MIRNLLKCILIWIIDMCRNLVLRDRLYNNTIIVLKCLMGDLHPQHSGSGPIIFKDRFDSFHVSITDIHLDYFRTLNDTLFNDRWLDHELLNRWKIVNQLIINHINYTFQEITTGFPHIQNRDGHILLQEKSLIIASFIAYPLLEEIACKISNAWNEEGNITIQTWKEDNFDKPSGAIVTTGRGYQIGNPISNLLHKLQIMKQFLNSEIIVHMNDLDYRLRRSPIEGDPNDVFHPLFNNLKKNRDKLLHGRDFDGYEAVYISLIIAMIFCKLSQEEIIRLQKCHENNSDLYPDPILHFPAPFSYPFLPTYLSITSQHS